MLTGKRALVTGGNTGIGRAICMELAARGASVVVCGQNEVTGRETLGLLSTAAGQKHYFCHMDVTKKESAAAGIAFAVEKLGGLDILCNNAGVSSMNRVEDMTEEEWDFNFNVNIKGVFLVTQAALPWLKQSRGRIVNTASMASIKAAPLLAHYSASKFGVLGFTKACALEFAEYGITVNCVCPGYVQTSMQAREIVWEGNLRGMTPQQVLDEYVANTPLGRLCTPEDVAKAVAFLVSDDAAYLTGVPISVAGGGDIK